MTDHETKIIIGSLLHDIGKVKAYDPIEGSFLQHEFFGESIVQKELKELKFSNELLVLI